MKGMSKDDWQNGNSTRSGLLWEVERILKEMTKEELPDILLMENVPQVHAEKNSIDFENWLRFLRSKGYQNYWQDINAKDLGIPQNRERTFCISILSDEYVEFEFPKLLKLEKVMKDFLEDSVDEKYYINNEKADKLIKELIDGGVLAENREQRTENREIIRQSICVSSPLEKSKLQTVSRQDMTQELATYRQTEAVLLTDQGRRIEKKTDIATCLMARDYKGFGNQESNGVIEIENRAKSK